MVTHLPPHADSHVFRAISDPTRRAILDGLAEGERTAGEVAGDFAVSRPAISKHLRILEEAGLVAARRAGRERRYRLDARPLGEVDRWVARHRTAWARRLVDLKEHLESTGDGRHGDTPGDNPGDHA